MLAGGAAIGDGDELLLEAAAAAAVGLETGPGETSGDVHVLAIP